MSISISSRAGGRYQFYAGDGGYEGRPRILAENVSETLLCLFRSHTERKGDEKMKWFVKTLFWILAFSAAILFSLENRSEVVLRFAFPRESHAWFEVPRVPLPIFLVILCAIFLGILIGGMGEMIQRFQLKRSLRKNQKKMEMLEREIESLRSPGSSQTSSLKEEG